MRDFLNFGSVRAEGRRHIFYISVDNKDGWMKKEQESWLSTIGSTRTRTGKELFLSHSLKNEILLPHTVFGEYRKTTSDHITNFVKSELNNETKQIHTVIFILSGHGFSSEGVSTLYLGGKQELRITELYTFCKKKGVLNVMFIADMCRGDDGDSKESIKWTDKTPNVVIIEATKRFQSACQVGNTGLLVSAVTGVGVDKLAHSSMNQLCIDIVVAAAKNIRQHVEFKDETKHIFSRIMAAVFQVWSSSMADPTIITREAMQRYFGYHLPQVYMTKAQGRTLSPEQIVILRQATGVPPGDLHSFKTSPGFSTVSYS